MAPDRSLADPGCVEYLAARIGRVGPGTPRAWGVMTSHQMICHLADAFRTMLGERSTSSKETFVSRTLIKWVALHSRLEWPKGVQTMPEVDQQLGGTKPIEFEADRKALIDLLRRFAVPGTRYQRHPIFGALTDREWQIWGFRHVDHHLRHFGV